VKGSPRLWIIKHMLISMFCKENENLLRIAVAWRASSWARFKRSRLASRASRSTFLIDANGILNVNARDERTGREHSVDVKPSYGLTDDEIERMLEEAIDLGEQDLESGC